MHKIISLFFLILFSSQVFAEEKLIFSADLIRHGDRNPEKEIPAAPVVWKEGLGELTPIGMNQVYRLGAMLRKKYVDEYHLLPANYDAKTMYVRSTDMNRTLMSATAFLFGLYPLESGALPSGFQPIPIHTVSVNQDTLLAVKGYSLTQDIWKEKSLLFKDKLPVWSKATGIQINSFRELGYLADNLRVRNIHHVSLPPGLSQSDANEMMAIAEWAMVEKFKRHAVTYSMGHELLSLIANAMKESIQHKSPLKYILFSGHDSSMMAVMNTLGSPLNHIPPYASRLNFSLWEDAGRYFVKVTLNDQPVVIPGCDKEICSMGQFYKIVGK